ncbi:MAG: methionyl-tRNA formyltransferase [Vicinamibacterales bacterium]
MKSSSTRQLRILYFGTPGFAVPALQALLTSRHEVVAVISQPDRPKGRGHRLAATPTKELAVLCGVPVLQPTRLKDDAFLADVVALRPDLGVVAAYGRILPDALLVLPRLGMINVHASLLPKYRGAAPVHRAVVAGDAETGVTIMRVVSELDAGPMIETVRRRIDTDETSVQVEQGLAELGAGILVDVVDRLSEGPVTEVPQEHALATYAPKITKAEGAIDWALPAAAIHNLVRGLQPWPLVAVTLDGVRCAIYRTSLSQPSGATIVPKGTAAEPGTVVTAAGDMLTIAAGDGRLIRIVEIQPDGRRVMNARDFLSGRTVSVGTRLLPL